MLITRLADQFLHTGLRSRWLPLLLVWLVFLSAWLPSGDPALGLFLVAELGILLIWQPVYQPRMPMSIAMAAQLTLAAALLLWLAGEPLLLMWAALVAGVFGGRAAGAPGLAGKWFHLILAVLLQLIVWLLLLPRVAGIESVPREFMRHIVIGALLLAALLPLGQGDGGKLSSRSVLYGLVFLLLTLLVGVGAVALSRIGTLPYLHAIALTLIGSGATLAAMIWLWNPHLGLGGIGSLAVMHLLEEGTPFEQWSAGLDARYVAESDPHRFLQGVAEDLLRMPGVVGLVWRCGQLQGLQGKHSEYQSAIEAGELQISFHTKRAATAAQRVQLELAARFWAHLYQAKVQESRQAEQTYLAAVHEAGARLTHDIKNILQGLAGLVAAGSSSDEPDRLVALYSRQLPELARRLELALTKLTRGATLQAAQMMALDEWWRRLGERYAACQIHFGAAPAGQLPIDAVLFDCVADNLLQNAMQKRLLERALLISVGCQLVEGGVLIEVSDNGSPIQVELAQRLGLTPLPSAHGMGIGILHACRLSLERGYQLALADNSPGRVRFVLGPLRSG